MKFHGFRDFKWKVFTTFILGSSFFIVTLSGIALYIAPSGKIARLAEWTFLWLDLHTWWELHLTSMFVVMVAAIFHLFWFNWKLFLSYLKRKGDVAVKRWREFLFASLATLILFIGTLGEWPVVYSPIDLFRWCRKAQAQHYVKIKNAKAAESAAVSSEDANEKSTDVQSGG
jgi:Domain of unknown function (DUF4405)